MREMQDYIDAQSGGPGKGFYRIVTSPFQARKVINAGQDGGDHGHGDQRAVRLHDEARRRPSATSATSTRQLDQLQQMGVRQVELVNKFDNALSGVAGDNGAVGAAVNAANFLETGSFWDMRHCEPADGESHDRDQVARSPGRSPPSSRTRSSARSGSSSTRCTPALPLYGPAHHCNAAA